MESGDYHVMINIPDIDIVLTAKGYNILIKSVDRHMKSTWLHQIFHPAVKLKKLLRTTKEFSQS